MARIRTIKPAFFRHGGLFDAEIETGLPLRVAYAGLWTACDREGRFEWKPRELKLDCLPYDKVDFARVLDALVTRGHVIKYAIDGVEFGCIPSWASHQVVNNRESPSAIPAPTEESIESATSTRDPRVPDACHTPLVRVQGEGKGREGKGKDYSSSRDDGAFVSFWSSYPRKVGKGAALARWGRLTAADRTAAIEAVPRFATAQNARPREDHRYCPHPATWLSERRWEDDPGEWTGSAPDAADALKRQDAAAKKAQLEDALKAEAEDDIRRMREARAARKAQEAGHAGA